MMILVEEADIGMFQKHKKKKETKFMNPDQRLRHLIAFECTSHITKRAKNGTKNWRLLHLIYLQINLHLNRKKFDFQSSNVDFKCQWFLEQINSHQHL
jgi:hypothetical protein